MRTLALLALLGLSSSALAVPLEFSHQGRLFDVAGAPLEGPNTLTLTLYDAPSGGNVLWTEEHLDLAFDGGYFGLSVGSVTPLPSELFTGDTLYLGLKVNSAPEMAQRLALVSVPYAVRAQESDHATVATSVSGGTVDATELLVNGTLIADGSGLHATPSAHTHDASEVASGVLEPARLPSHVHDAGDLSTGTVDMNRLPVGTSPDTVARGNHVHTAADVGALPVGTTAVDIGGLASTTTAADIGALPVGTTAADIGGLPIGTTAVDIGGLASTTTAADIGALPVGTRAVDIGGLASTTTAADIGALPVGTTAADIGAVAVGSAISLGDNTAACGSVDAPAGSMRFHAGAFEGCFTDTWVPLVAAFGTSQALAGRSCAAILAQTPSASSGVYWVDPDGGNTSNAVEVWCDMTTDGGGWMLIANNDNADTEPTGCYAQIASDPGRACGTPTSPTADFAVLASGLSFQEMVFAAYTGNYQVSSYQYMTWTAPQTIPNTVADWWFNADAWNQPLADWPAAGNIQCDWSGLNRLRSVGTLARPRGGSAYGNSPVTMFSGDIDLANAQMSFTEATAHAPGQSMNGLEDFQDGWGCGDAWSPQADRGKSAFIMIR